MGSCHTRGLASSFLAGRSSIFFLAGGGVGLHFRIVGGGVGGGVVGADTVAGSATPTFAGGKNGWDQRHPVRNVGGGAEGVGDAVIYLVRRFTVGVILRRHGACPAFGACGSASFGTGCCIGVCRGHTGAVTGIFMVGEGLQHLNVHAFFKVVPRVQHGDGVAGGAQGVGDGVPAEADEVHAHPVFHGCFHAGDHVGVAGHEHNIADDAADGAQHHVGDESCVYPFLGAAVAPFSKLAGAQLDAVDVAERALVAVGAGVGDAVIPELAVDRKVDFVANNCIKVAGYSR